MGVYEGGVLLLLFFCACSKVEVQKRIKKKWSNREVIRVGMIHLVRKIDNKA